MRPVFIAIVLAVLSQLSAADSYDRCLGGCLRYSPEPSRCADICRSEDAATLVEGQPGPPPLVNVGDELASSGGGSKEGLCSEGILSSDGTVCCALSCGVCEPQSRCSALPGGADACCPKLIEMNEVPCFAASDVVSARSRRGGPRWHR